VRGADFNRYHFVGEDLFTPGLNQLLIATEYCSWNPSEIGRVDTHTNAHSQPAAKTAENSIDLSWITSRRDKWERIQ